jgi:hypothetical protein
VKPLAIKPRTVAAIAATVGTLAKATGTTWGYDQESDSFYEMTPTKNTKIISPTYVERETQYGGEYVNANIIDAWEALMESGIPNREYSIGDQPDQQGRLVDKTEYVCKQFAIDAVTYLNSRKDEKGNQKFNTKLVLILGTYSYGYDEYGNDLKGKEIGHAAIKVEDRTNAMAYWIDPSAGVWSEKEETQLESMQKWINDPRSYVPFATTRIPITTRVEYAETLIEPQTGQTGETGYDLTGTNMMIGEKEYTIKYMYEMDTPITEEKRIQFDDMSEKKEAYILPTPINNENVIAHKDETKKDDMQEEINKSLRQQGYDEKFIEKRRADVYYITEKQPTEIEKENAKIRLNAMKNKKQTKSIEELKQLNPLESIEQQSYNKKTTGVVKTPIEITSAEEKQLEEIAKEMEKTEMWTGE